MLDLIRAALKTSNTIIPLPQPYKPAINHTYLPLITTKNYHYKSFPLSQTTYARQIIDYTNLYVQYIARVTINGHQTFSFRFIHTNNIKDICLFLLKTVQGNAEFMYMQINQNIYTCQPDFLRESLDHLHVCNFTFLKFGSTIGDEMLPNSDMHFFDGNKQIYAIKIERVHCVYNKVEMMVCEVYDRVILCKACGKNNSQVIVIDDPILPQKDKHLCKVCFCRLFVGNDGNLKYKNMDYKYL